MVPICEHTTSRIIPAPFSPSPLREKIQRNLQVLYSWKTIPCTIFSI